jgi:hypothetical protein
MELYRWAVLLAWRRRLEKCADNNEGHNGRNMRVLSVGGEDNVKGITPTEWWTYWCRAWVLEERDEVTDSRRALTVEGWERRFDLKSWAISRTRRWKSSLQVRSSVDDVVELTKTKTVAGAPDNLPDLLRH